MAGPNVKKRSHQDFPSKGKPHRPSKKQRNYKVAQYHSDSDSNPDFTPVYLDSDNEDLDNAAVDDIASGSGSGSDSRLDSDATESRPTPASKKQKPQNPKKAEKGGSGGEDSDGQDSSGGEDDDEEDESDSGAEASTTRSKKSKSKRNDPDAFATSINKILSTKLSTTRRADPVLSRSADAHKAAKEAVESALDSKARKHLREQKRLASEKGRVRDVLVGATNPKTGEPETSTGEILQTEKRLRKVAHRGVIMLFRAVREAQERAADADKEARKDGITGVMRREEKVNEMSRQGFLDLIAGGGGKSKRGASEE
ncbi:Uu.00g006070.m01.CDS01 [Anthostomella pinea]|uniref:Uu.00g006070.m01.CDS01 n=1 Tax=Anthostomella pinea TaxID=933095 RepID=A0AAI8VKY4_9PEZI|nr:Uu.00g006070.m01.CDS01 [Anthostomella pinea]